MDVIRDNSYVIVEKYQYMRTLFVKSSRPIVQLGKDSIDMAKVIGAQYESVFKMIPDPARSKGWTLEAVAEDQVVDFEERFEDRLSSGGSGSGQDNRDLSDKNCSQGLKRDDIEAMKDDRIDGMEIVDKIIENSASFSQKTKFSQAKFLKKKAKKYFQYVRVKRPTIRLLLDIHYKSDPMKIMNLRADSLAQLLNNANVQAGGKYIVYETGCQGIVVSAALDRLGVDSGTVVSMYQTGNPQTNCLNAMNYPEERLKQRLLHLNTFHMRAIEQGEDLTAMHQNDVTGGKPQRQAYREQSVLAHDLLKQGDMDGLIIASRQHPTNLLLKLMTYLAPSRPFAVYSPYKEPLLDAYNAVKATGKAVMVTLNETWLRHYQVLPDRTHPQVLMSGGGGYVLQGTVVDDAEPEGYEMPPPSSTNHDSGRKRRKFRR